MFFLVVRPQSLVNVWNSIIEGGGGEQQSLVPYQSMFGTASLREEGGATKSGSLPVNVWNSIIEGGGGEQQSLVPYQSMFGTASLREEGGAT